MSDEIRSRNSGGALPGRQDEVSVAIPRLVAGSAWETAPDELSDMSLIDVLDEPGLRGDLDSTEQSRQQIRLHEAPPGFRALMGKLADELFVSYSALSRLCLGHGLAKLEDKQWIGRLKLAYGEVRRRGMDLGDPDALSRLNLTSKYSFVQPRPISTTLDASRATAARISDLAMVCGVPRAVVAVIAVSLSLLSLPNNRGYRTLLEAEIDAFRRFVIRRTKELRLGDVL
jgi:hypothetical protein